MPEALTLTQVRDKLTDRQQKMHKVFEEATVTTDSGQKAYDFNKVKCLGDDVKGSIAVAEKIKAMDEELNELAQQAETLEAAEKAAGNLNALSKVRNRPPLPGGGDKTRERPRVKSLGELLAEEKAYKDWMNGGGAGGITLQFDDALPSDFLAKALSSETIGAKALMSTSAGYAPESLRLPGFVEMATRPIQLLDIIPIAQTGQAAVPYMEETTRTHAAAETAEGDTFAESAFAFTERTSPVRKITDSVPVTDEQLEDVAFIQSYINSRLMFGIRQRLDTQSLIGDGTGVNLRGLKNTPGIQTQAKGADPVPDVFYKAMTKIRVTGRAVPTHHVMHPEDWQDVRLLRTTEGVYIWGPPSDTAPERMWGLPVVQQDADAKGTGYTGSFRPEFVTLYERRGVDIQIGYVGTQFGQGRRTVRGDMRAALIFSRPAAFCENTGL